MKRWGLFVCLLVGLSGIASANYHIQNSVLLDTGAVTVNVADSGAAGSTETVTMYVTANQRVEATFSQINVPPSTSTVYSTCHDPCTVLENRESGDVYYWYVIVDTNSNIIRTSNRGVLASYDPPCSAPGSWTLPIEVIGGDNFKVCTQLNNATGVTTGLRLYARLSNTGYVVPGTGKPSNPNFYDGKASVRVNAGSWIDLNCSTATEIDENRFIGTNIFGNPPGYGSPGYCTIGNQGGPAALEMTVPIPNNLVIAGTNSVTFRFNGTDGNSAGYRVLAYNFLENSVVCDTFTITSNVATAQCSTAHGWSNGDWVKFYSAPGMFGMLNGGRHLTGVATTTATFATCGGTVNTISTSACTSPNGSYFVPIMQNSTYTLTTTPISYGAKQLIPETSFTWDDPTLWIAPPSGNATNGQSIWSTGTLVLPNSPYTKYATTYKCSTCHDTLGRDMKYFNYSNASLEARSTFHGLSIQDGLDVAAYIRGLSTTTNITVTPGPTCRPWNPVYQPGPGIDEAPEIAWACGAGIDAQLVYDHDLRLYISSNNFANLMPAADFNGRETPLLWQTKIWNQMLPPIPSGDFIPSTNFFGSILWTNWVAARDGITPNNFLSWQNFDGFAFDFLDPTVTLAPYITVFDAALAPNLQTNPGFNPPSLFTVAENSARQFYVVKQFELMNFYGLQGMATSYITQQHASCYNSASYESRNWSNTDEWFVFAQHFNTDIPSINTIPNRSAATWNYDSNIQYTSSMGIENGNRWLGDHSPIDMGYLDNFLTGTGEFRPDAWEGQLGWVIGLQSQWCNPLPSDDNSGVNLNGVAPLGILPNTKRYAYLFSTASDVAEMTTQYSSGVVAMINNWTTGQWQTFALINSQSGACTSNPGSITPANYGGVEQGYYCDEFAYVLPILKYWGAPSSLYNAIEAWAASIWTVSVTDQGGGLTGTMNWSHQLNAVCTESTGGGGNDGTLWPVCSNSGNFSSNATVTPGTQTIAVAGGDQLLVGGLYTIDTGANQENVTALSGTNQNILVATFVNSHSGTYRVVGAL